MKVVPIGFNSPLTRSEWLILLSSGLGVLHHIDHVLRFDHSGWPFRDIVTPFTYSLLVYPLLAVAFSGAAEVGAALPSCCSYFF